MDVGVGSDDSGGSSGFLTLISLKKLHRLDILNGRNFSLGRSFNIKMRRCDLDLLM